jgi:ribose-phosphate pyrophosphokinase
MRITAVMPYYGYARQDRKVVPRVPISAKLVADLITTAGASRMLTMDLHSGQIQGFFDIPVDNVYATPVLLEHLRKQLNNNEVTIVSPDAGGVERARAIATRLDASLAIIDKRASAQRGCGNNIIGRSGSDRHPLGWLIDTAGRLPGADLKREGKKFSVVARTRWFPACDHGSVGGESFTNTIPLAAEASDSILKYCRSAPHRRRFAHPRRSPLVLYSSKATRVRFIGGSSFETLEFKCKHEVGQTAGSKNAP